jgi:hypothetical protein
MSCDCTEKISSLIDGELPPAEAREVERHLLNCGECQQVRADFLNLRSQIIGLAPSVEHAVQRQALARILSPKSKDRARLGAGAKPTSRGFGWRWSFNSAMGAFATFVVVGVLVALFFYQRSDRQTPNATQVAMQTASPVPSASVDRKDEPKPTETKEPASGIEQPPRSKDDNESKTPRRPPVNPVRRPSPPVREPRPGEQFATIPDRVRSADSETMTAMHFEKSELLLRAFRNVRLSEPGTAAEFGYERKRAQQLVYQNMILRREADAAGDVQVAALLESLEPILLDIANLPDDAGDDAVSAIKARVERKNIVALLQVNSTALARALD